SSSGAHPWRSTVSQAARRSSPTVLTSDAGGTTGLMLAFALPGPVGNRAQGGAVRFALSFTVSGTGAALGGSPAAGAARQASIPVSTATPAASSPSALAFTGATPLLGALLGLLLIVGGFTLRRLRRGARTK
ncbi:MAG: hypothetical protein ACRDRL_30700, partial [Sciscionella sp.]